MSLTPLIYRVASILKTRLIRLKPANNIEKKSPLRPNSFKGKSQMLPLHNIKKDRIRARLVKCSYNSGQNKTKQIKHEQLAKARSKTQEQESVIGKRNI